MISINHFIDIDLSSAVSFLSSFFLSCVLHVQRILVIYLLSPRPVYSHLLHVFNSGFSFCQILNIFFLFEHLYYFYVFVYCPFFRWRVDFFSLYSTLYINLAHSFHVFFSLWFSYLVSLMPCALFRSSSSFSLHCLNDQIIYFLLQSEHYSIIFWFSSLSDTLLLFLFSPSVSLLYIHLTRFLL